MSSLVSQPLEQPHLAVLGEDRGLPLGISPIGVIAIRSVNADTAWSEAVIDGSC